MKLSLITATHLRSHLLADCALPSVLKQTDCEFEWIVVNDGKDAKTDALMQSIQAKCSLIYLEMEHPQLGFGLCHARNLGLSAASGDLVSYLDDDNTIAPTFVAEVKAFFQQSSQVRASMVQQCRRRNIVQNRKLIKQGQPFISPNASSTVSDLVQQRSLFDSNGFTHYRENAPCWNPEYKVFADYDYFLRCLTRWGNDSFCLHPSVLVDYVQASDGVIGRSTYGEWATELSAILEQHRDALTQTDHDMLNGFVQKWQVKQAQSQHIPAFHPNDVKQH
ncbi:hypothetical protein LEP3755_62760 (plasmid) [Leptolyngbya sp. NIES-3755]|nr:hypothetical protein LEP3755_62760 [Leptolyngbya sp. NIES-3755]